MPCYRGLIRAAYRPLLVGVSGPSSPRYPAFGLPELRVESLWPSAYGMVTDSCPSTGITAYATLLWLNLSTLAPFRDFSYEFFVIQDLIAFIGFINRHRRLRTPGFEREG